ncbi:MAG: TonB-dependent receptor [Kiritimatiellae bacterium]|nr:TonB-dependent receptor [Kiritimatiellia bacterium]MDW8457693.1 TonB-dependent receptor [Verrucomicrobiota bacterium]
MVICLTWRPVGHAQGERGALRGQVIDADFGDPVQGATLRILEQDISVNSDREGFFLFPDLPPGSYSVAVTREGYQRAVLSGVVVPPGTVAELNVRLSSELTEMEELVVRESEPETDTATEAGLLTLRAQAITFQDAVSRELMSRAGASDAAAAVRLVVGTTIVDGKYASVRGLSDRYVGASVNGFRIPSADPKRRAVQLDVFPAGTIDSISVSKTFTPDLPGDFSGGGINLKLLSIPDERFLKLSFSREINRNYHGSERFITYEGGGVDVWARQRGERDMPDGAATMEDDGLLDTALPSNHEQLLGGGVDHSALYLRYDRITRSMAPAMGIKYGQIPENFSINASIGNAHPLIGDSRLGALIAFTYSQKHSLRTNFNTAYVRPSLGNPQVTNLFDTTREEGVSEVKYGLLITSGVKNPERSEISVTFFRVRSGTDQASFTTEGFDDTTLEWEQKQAIHYIERSTDSLQFRGEHNFDEMINPGLGLRLQWFGGHNVVRQYEPDVRYFENVVVRQGNLFRYQQLPPGASGAAFDKTARVWRDTQEDNTQYGLNVAVPFDRQFHPRNPDGTRGDVEKSGALKFGWVRDITLRTYRQNSFFYTFGAQLDPIYTGPVRAQFPPGFAGQIAFINARNAWLASSTGQIYLAKMADAAADRLKSSFVSSSPTSLWTDVFLNPTNIGVGSKYKDSMYWYISPKLYDVSYDGDQDFPAGYAMLELPMNHKLIGLIGLRAENTLISVDPTSDMDQRDPPRAFQVAIRRPQILPDGTETYYYTIGGVSREEARVDIDESHLLRAAGLVYEPRPDMKLRYNYAQTIARPTFWELAPVITFDYVDGIAYVGNKDLRVSTVENHDIRWEWYPAEETVVSASVFEKQIDDPIDKESFSYLSQDYVLAVNYPHGTVRGLELEVRRPVPAPPYLPGRLILGANYTKIDASVEIPDQVRYNLARHSIYIDERDMEGQPDYLLNLNATYEITPRASFSYFFNKRGDMLKTGAAVGEDGATPDIYSLARETVDLAFEYKFGRQKQFKLTLRAKNTTDPVIKETYRLPDGTDIPRRSYREGVAYSVSLGGEW